MRMRKSVGSMYLQCGVAGGFRIRRMGGRDGVFGKRSGCKQRLYS